MKYTHDTKIVGKTIGVGIRWGLNLFITYNIWTHSHWSVALSITLMTIAFEIQALRSFNK